MVNFRYNGEEDTYSNSYETIEDPDYYPLINYYGGTNKRSTMPDQPIKARPNRNAPRKHLRLNLFSTVL